MELSVLCITCWNVGDCLHYSQCSLGNTPKYDCLMLSKSCLECLGLWPRWDLRVPRALANIARYRDMDGGH